MSSLLSCRRSLQGMPAPKRGFSLTSDAMLELARESEAEANKIEGEKIPSHV